MSQALWQCSRQTAISFETIWYLYVGNQIFKFQWSRPVPVVVLPLSTKPDITSKDRWVPQQIQVW